MASSSPLRSRIVYGVLLAVIVGGLVALGVMILDKTGDVVDTADRFMSAMVEQRTGDAWSLLAPETQKQLETPDRLMTAIMQRSARPTAWSYGRKRVTDHYATFPLKLRWSDGTTSQGALHLRRGGERWEVTGIKSR